MAKSSRSSGVDVIFPNSFNPLPLCILHAIFTGDMEFTPNVIRYGAREPLKKAIQLHAGPVALQFEPDTAYLRYFRVGDFELLRGIYGSVRNQFWNTILPELSNVKVQDNTDSFEINFDAQCASGDLSYFWKGRLTGSANGEVTYSFSGEAHSDFLKNRIGLCILHPILECAGKKVVVEHADGTTSEGIFPKEISPHQPFFNIRGLKYWLHNGVEISLQCEGDIFEMEDQRNWGDWSYKTYCTPQSIPFPAAVKKGDRVEQKVTFRLGNLKAPMLPIVQGRPPQISIITTPAYALPAIGTQIASHNQPLTNGDIDCLRALKLNHLRCDLYFSEPIWKERLAQADTEARGLGCKLHLGLVLTPDFEAQLAELSEQFGAVKDLVSLFLLFHQSENPITPVSTRKAQNILEKFAPGVLCAAGTLDFFTEINRNRPPADSTAFPVWSINPQVHAFDNSTMIENLTGFANALSTVQTFSAKPPLISPVTLRIRARGSFDDVDPRQISLFTAGWTASLISQLATANHLHSLTLFETTGCRGLLESDEVTPHPDTFPTEPGLVFPVYHVLADLVGFTQVYGAQSTLPLQVQALALVNAKGQRRLIVANLLNENQNVKIKSGSASATVRYLDERNAITAMRNPKAYRSEKPEKLEPIAGKLELEMLPYAVATLDLSGK